MRNEGLYEGKLLSKEEIDALLEVTGRLKETSEEESDPLTWYDIKIPVDCSFSLLIILVQMLINDWGPISENDAIAKHELFKQWLTPRKKQ